MIGFSTPQPRTKIAPCVFSSRCLRTLHEWRVKSSPDFVIHCIDVGLSLTCCRLTWSIVRVRSKCSVELLERSLQSTTYSMFLYFVSVQGRAVQVISETKVSEVDMETNDTVVTYNCAIRLKFCRLNCSSPVLLLLLFLSLCRCCCCSCCCLAVCRCRA
jgi:hypothetical protein